MKNRISIPSHFYEVKYVSGRIPGCESFEDLNKGANCQLYAYSLLRFFGKNVPDFRSKEMWEDTRYSLPTHIFKPLDLMFYHKEHKVYGAHVGVYIGNDEIIHLSKQNGSPEIVRHDSMLSNALYSCFIGAKRFKP